MVEDQEEFSIVHIELLDVPVVFGQLLTQREIPLFEDFQQIPENLLCLIVIFLVPVVHIDHIYVEDRFVEVGFKTIYPVHVLSLIINSVQYAIELDFGEREEKRNRHES